MGRLFERMRSFIAERFRDINRQLLYAAAILILYGIFSSWVLGLIYWMLKVMNVI